MLNICLSTKGDLHPSRRLVIKEVGQKQTGQDWILMLTQLRKKTRTVEQY